MSTLFKLSQTNFNAALPEYQSNLYMLFCQDKKLRQEVCYPCGCLVCLASCVCLSPPPPPAARWVFLPPSSSLLLLERARVTFPRPTQLACCSLSSAGSTIRLPLSLPPSPAPLMRAGRPGSGRREREERGMRAGEGKKLISLSGRLRRHFISHRSRPADGAARGGKGSIPR